MSVIRFRVRHPEGRVDELVTETPRVLIGAGSHCEIRLPIGAARVEHVLIQSTPSGLRAIARAFDPVPDLDGVEFTEAPIRGECVIGIGKMRIDVVPSTLPGDAVTPRAKGSRNPRIYIYMALGVACSLALYAARSPAKTSTPEPKNVPSLWAAEASPPCPQTAPEPALASANDRLDLAIAKQERSPFHPEDGVAAVPLYEAAEACFRSSGHALAAAEAGASAERLRVDMKDRLRVHRLRLQRSLALEEWGAAEHESSILLSFWPAGTNEYVGWLSNLRRRLELRYGAKGKKT